MPKSTLSEAVPSTQSDFAEVLRFDELDSLLGYRLRRAQGAMHRDFMAAIAELQLTQKQVASLWLIGANAGISQASLADALDIDRATMMAIVDRLERRKLLVRERSAADRRRQELYLTPAGQSILRKARTRIAQHERKFRSRLRGAELGNLLSVLDKLAKVS